MPLTDRVILQGALIRPPAVKLIDKVLPVVVQVVALTVPLLKLAEQVTPEMPMSEAKTIKIVGVGLRG